MFLVYADTEMLLRTSNEASLEAKSGEQYNILASWTK